MSDSLWGAILAERVADAWLASDHPEWHGGHEAARDLARLLRKHPTPPPLYSLTLKMHNARVMDSRPQVINMNNFCGRAGFDPVAKFCFTRREGDPQSEACDYLAVGKASDTGRWGPTWSWNDQPCRVNGGCTNHPDNQFLVITNATGKYLACVSPEVPLSTDPVRPGSRCGICTITENEVVCNHS